MSDDLLKFDFGFTAVDESELEELEDKLNKLYNAILPLLTNLKKNPEKEYILWPNRTEKIEAFENHISGIIK